ncbi:MAG TPA: nucleotidyltransferase family protein [Rhodanobacteraceae bacterium]|nr:nucleotidyltransferase family protein [Rhodanobacteraceae bacterium]
MQANDRASIETWIAAALMERRPAWPCAPGEGVEAVVDLSNAEGVACLLHARLHASAMAVPDALRDRLDALVRAKAAQSLYQQAQCRAILARLDAAGIPALLLKGLALGCWCYAAPHLRECGDIDLLLSSREDAQRAVELLAPLGYAPPEVIMPGDMVRFETPCVRPADRGALDIDLHWRLSNAPLFAFRFAWEDLRAASMPIPALGSGARGLSAPLAMLHACMHRVKHLAEREDRMKWLFDYVVLARRFGDGDWCALRDLAISRGLAGVCVACLHAAEARFGGFVPVAVMDQLAGAARGESLQVERVTSHWYFQCMNWRAFPTARMRWRWLRQQLVPDAAYLRKRYGTSVPGALWRRAWAGVRRLRG